MAKELTFIIILIVLSIYIYYNDKAIDTFANTESDIKNTINDVYSANIEKIRTLYTTANRIQNEGLILNEPNSINNANIKGTLNVTCETNLKNKLDVNGETTINNPININNSLNIKSSNSVVSLEGSRIELYTKTKVEGIKSWIGYNSNDLNIQNEDIGSIIIGNTIKNDAIKIDDNGDTTINGKLTINGGNLPMVNCSYKNGTNSGTDINTAGKNVQISLSKCEYTPIKKNTLIHITCDCDYSIIGWYDDDYESYIYINGQKVHTQLQHFKAVTSNKHYPGGDTRGATIFPLSYMLMSDANNPKITIEIKVAMTWGDDKLTVKNKGFLLMVNEYNATELT